MHSLAGALGRTPSDVAAALLQEDVEEMKDALMSLSHLSSDTKPTINLQELKVQLGLDD